MEFRLLGPSEVTDGAGPLPLGGARQRALQALLLLHRGELMPVERLVDELWGETPPRTAAQTVRVYVSQLRKTLGQETVETQGPA